MGELNYTSVIIKSFSKCLSETVQVEKIQAKLINHYKILTVLKYYQKFRDKAAE